MICPQCNHDVEPYDFFERRGIFSWCALNKEGMVDCPECGREIMNIFLVQKNGAIMCRGCAHYKKIIELQVHWLSREKEFASVEEKEKWITEQGEEDVRILRKKPNIGRLQ